VDDLLRRAADSADASRAPLRLRNELRGLLDAYTAMAARAGVLEGPDFGTRRQLAHEALYTAPTDLALAAALVRSCQDLLRTELQEGREPC
jgi:hypothetical protein